MSTPNHADSAAVKPQRLDSQRSVIKSHIPPGPVFWNRSWGRRRVKRRGSAAPSRPHEREEPRKKAAQGEPRPGHGAHGAKPRASNPRSELEAAEGATRPRGFGGQRGPEATGARPPEPPGTRRRSGGRRTGGGRSRSAGRKPRAPARPARIPCCARHVMAGCGMGGGRIAAPGPRPAGVRTSAPGAVERQRPAPPIRARGLESLDGGGSLRQGGSRCSMSARMMCAPCGRWWPQAASSGECGGSRST